MSVLVRFRGAILLTLALLALGVALWVRGTAFYSLDLDARVDHADFRVLSPGSPVGHGYGIVGTLLMLTNLLYLVRRRVARWQLGSMRVWLDMHVFTGLFGSMLVVFHSAFQLRSQVATITAVSLAFVVLSGLIGRYFFGLTPRTDHSALDECLAALDALAQGLGRRIAAELAVLPAPSSPSAPTLLASLSQIPSWMREASTRKAVVRRVAAPVLAQADADHALQRSLRPLVKRSARLATDPVRTVAGASLLRTWRGLHRFMALLMIISVTVHIVVAWLFGFRWIFSE